MKKTILAIFTVLIGLTLVACKPKEVNNSYRMAFGEAKNLNRLTSQNKEDSTVSDYLVGAFYLGDYDWQTAIDKGIATKKGDFSKIKRSDDDTTKEFTIEDLGYIYNPSDAAKYPYAVNQQTDATKSNGRLDVEKSKTITDTKWQIKMREDLQFSDGTAIDSSTVEYTVKQYLSPDLLAVRGNHIYDENYLNLVKAEEYFKQKTPNKDGQLPQAVAWEEVGFKVIDKYTFEITSNEEDSHWGIIQSLTVLDLVHPAKFEAGYNADKTVTTYGSIDNIPPSYGAYVLSNWEQAQKFTFDKNQKYHAKNDYKIEKIEGPIIKAQGTIIEEFKAGNLDVAGVSGIYFKDFIDNPALKITKSNSFFRLDLSLDRSRGGAGSKGTESAILKYDDFRQALLLGIDRNAFVQGPVAPAEPLVGYVSNIHRTKEESAQYYNSTSQHKELLQELKLDENAGYNPTEAKKLFDKAYAQAVADGKIVTGKKATIEYSFYDVESNQNIAKALKAQYEGLFGKDKFEWINKGRGKDDHEDHTKSGDFDMAFNGLSGGNYMTVELFDMVYGSGGFYDGRGFDIRGTEVRPVRLLRIFDIISEKPEATRTDAEKALLSKLDANGIFHGTFLELSKLYSGFPGFSVAYEGRDEDLANMVQALEGVMFELVPSVPLFSSVSSAVYSSRVKIHPPVWYEKMGWGGIRYMEIINK